MTHKYVDNYVEIGDLSENLVYILKNEKRYPRISKIFVFQIKNSTGQWDYVNNFLYKGVGKK